MDSEWSQSGDAATLRRHVSFAAAVGADDDLRWAATHGPIKTFGLAGICDTLLVTGCAAIEEGSRAPPL